MPVYFIHRSFYGNPGAKYLRVFEADTVLEWFQSIWQGKTRAEERTYSEQLLGADVYSFSALFETIHTHQLTPPTSMTMLMTHLQSSLAIEEQRFGAHHLQILTGDDELEMAIYFFDGHYVAEKPHRAAYLIHPHWQLPDGGSPEGKQLKGPTPIPHSVIGEGCTYLVHFAAYDSGGLSDLDQFGPVVVPGVRIADFPRALMVHESIIDKDRYDETIDDDLEQLVSGLKSYTKSTSDEEFTFLQALAANPNDSVAWNAFSDWQEEHDRELGGRYLLEQILRNYVPVPDFLNPKRDPLKDLVFVQQHIAQACKHIGGEKNTYHHLILFDDYWANAHPDLARSMIRYASRWDCL